MKRLYWILIVLLALGLTLVACGGGDEPAAEPAAPAPAVESAPAEAEAEPAQAAVPTIEPTAVPTAEPTPEPTEEPVEVSWADLNFTSAPEELESYRYEMIISASGVDQSGAEVTQSITILMAYTTDPQAMSISMKAEGTGMMADDADMDSLGFENFEIVQIGAMSYMVFPEFGCMAFPAEEDLTENPMLSEFAPETMFGDLSGVKLVGEEERAGFRVLHYTFDETSLPTEDQQDIRVMNGHLYIAKEGGFLVSMIVDLEGNAEEFLTGLDSVEDATVRMEFNLQDINEPIEILLPEGCEEQAAGDLDYPILEDATDLFNMFGMISYTTAVSVDEAIEFYQNEMAELGYTYSEDESFIFGSTAMLVFNSSDGSVSINISESEGETSVLIFAGE